MKAQNEHAGIAAKNFLRRDILMNTKGQCMKESKGSLAEHQRKYIQYPCGQCGKQFSQRGYLARHQRAPHEGIKYSAENVTIKQQQMQIWLNIKGEYTKESNILAGNVVNNFLRRELGLDTKGQHMKESNIYAEK